MTPRIRECGEYAAGFAAAVVIAGLIYVGVVLLNDAPEPRRTQVVEGAVRLAKPFRAPSSEPLRREAPRQLEPPKSIPLQAAANSRCASAEKVIAMPTPSFEAPLGPGTGPGLIAPEFDSPRHGFEMEEVDEAPQIVRSAPPEYPYAAKRSRLEGRVVVRMLVTCEGAPSDLSIQSASPPGVFDEAALKAAARWRFLPGKYKGEAVDTWVLLPFEFELSS